MAYLRERLSPLLFSRYMKLQFQLKLHYLLVIVMILRFLQGNGAMGYVTVAAMLPLRVACATSAHQVSERQVPLLLAILRLWTTIRVDRLAF